MKTLLRIAIALSLVLAATAFTLFYAFSDSQRVANVEKTPNSMPFYLKGTQISPDKALDFFKELSSTYRVSVVKSTNETQHGQAITVKSGVFYPDTFPTAQLGIIQGSFDEDGSGFIASYPTGNPDQSGLMYDFAGDDRVVVQTLQRAYANQGDVDGNYTLESSVPIDRAALDDIGRFFSIDQDMLLTKTNSKSESISLMFFISLGGLALLMLLAALLNVVAPFSRIKRIGTEKLLGWSNRTSWFASNKTPFGIALGCAILLIAASLLIPGWTPVFCIGLAGTLLATFVAMLTLSGLAFLVISRFKAASALKGEAPTKIPLAATIVLKVLFIGCVCFASLPIANNIQILVKDYNSQKHWLEYGDYLTISSTIATGDDLNSFATGDSKLADKFASLYDDLNDELDGVFAMSSDYLQGSGGGFASTYQTLTVNPHYFDHQRILDPNGTPYSFSDDDASLIILVPQSRAAETDQFIEQAKIDRLQEEDSVARRQTGKTPTSADEAQRKQDMDVRCLLYDDSAPLFSFDTNVAASDDFLLHSPLIKVATEANMTQNTKWTLQTTGLNEPMKIPPQPDAKSRFLDIAKRHGFADGTFFVDTLENAIASEIAQAGASMRNLVLLLCVLAALCAFSSYTLVKVVLAARKRWLDVASFLGYSFRARHWQLMGGLAIIYLAGLGVAGALSNDILAPAIVLAALVVDALITFVVLRNLERKSAAALLKGR